MSELNVEKTLALKRVATALLDSIARNTLEWKIHWLLRIALFCEFVGHGAFGVLTKQAWLPYFARFGIPEAWAWTLMPIVGSMDIALGVLALLAPTRAGILYMALWGLFTALLRPLTGEGWWEFFERAYNFGVLGLMLWMHSAGADRTAWFAVLTTMTQLTRARVHTYQWVLRGIMASMLIGHGGFGLVMGKPNLLQFYEAVGLGVLGVPLPYVSAVLGGFEILLGLACLGANSPLFFLFVFVWKLSTEFLYVPAQAYGAWWEVMERGSSYAAPLIWVALHTFVKDVNRAMGSPRERTITPVSDQPMI